MALRVVDESGKTVEFVSPMLTPEAQGFRISAENVDLSIFITYVPQIFNDIDPNQYLVFLLSRPEFSENDIFTVFSKTEEKRVGLIFPLQATRSLEHKFSGDRAFLRFSQAAFMRLCQGFENCYLKIPTVIGERELDIFDFYSEDSIVLVLYRPALDEPDSFRIDTYLPSLFKYGYFLQSANIDPGTCASVGADLYKKLEAKLTIRPISESFSSAQFVVHAMQSTLPYEGNPLMVFFYHYQLIELLIGEVLDTTFQEFKEQLAADAAISTSIRDTLNTLNESLNEKARIKRLFNVHIGVNPETSDLRLRCNEFLNINGVVLKKSIETQHFADYLYETRNVLFHNLRNVAPQSLKVITEINELLRPVLCDMLINYVARPHTLD